MSLRLCLGAFSVAAGLVWAQSKDEAARTMSEGAEQLLRSLPPELRTEANLPFEGDERANWHYIPRDRKGVSYKAMTPAQQKLATSLLATGLSPRGMSQALDVMYLDQILFEREKRPIRDPDLYYFTIFGEPSPGARWGWRVEGHHLSLNFTLERGRVLSTSPAFFGANPAVVKDGVHEGMRVLADEEILGRELLHTFDARDRVVIQAEAPRDIVTESSRRAEIGAPAGVSYADMSPSQREGLIQIVGFYAHRMRSDVAVSELERIESAGLEKIYFAWAGGAKEGEPHYYRIHGPTFLVEYDNTQNDANHIHTVWRDLERDFGGVDPLTDHYAKSPHHRHRHAGEP